jgi:hypothetical protein
MGFFKFFKKKDEPITISDLTKQMRAEGMTDVEIEKILLKDLHEGGQIFGDFRKQMNATVKGGIENVGQSEVRESFLNVELWDWVGIVDGKICPDCLERHKTKAKTWEDWEEIGLPESGATSCGKECRCILVPEGDLEKD